MVVQSETESTGAARQKFGQRRCLLVALFLCLTLPGSSAGAGESASLHIIVHPENPTSVADREFLADAFLKKKTRWGDSETIEPVDLKPSSTLRKHFSKTILRRSVAAIRHYWQQRIFTGRGVPPPELKSESDVVEYVLKHRGAVGYVSSSTDRRNAKVLSVRY